MVVAVRKARRYPTVTIDFGDDILGALDQLCAETGSKLSPLVRDLVADHLREMGRLPPLPDTDVEQ